MTGDIALARPAGTDYGARPNNGTAAPNERTTRPSPAILSLPCARPNKFMEYRGIEFKRSFETSAATGNGRCRWALGARLDQAKPPPKELRYSRFGRRSIGCWPTPK
jgi:hypothetical protein